MMQHLLLSILLLFAQEDSLRFDFGQNKESPWFSVNDGVMGGRSQGSASYDKDILSFTGSISFENNGRFASVRSEYFSRDMQPWESVTIRYRSDGQALAFGLEHHRQWYLPDYKVTLDKTALNWTEITFDLTEFKGYRIGNPTGNFINSTQLSKIIRFSITTSDKVEGPFKSEIDYIEFSK